jgi:hypothetical protein
MESVFVTPYLSEIINLDDPTIEYLPTIGNVNRPAGVSATEIPNRTFKLVVRTIRQLT